MTTFVNIPNGDIDQDSPITQQLMTALRDNVPATAEGSSGAPVLATGWHPYNMVNVGDGATGLIYDFSVDGTVSAIITPDFEDGYEYRLHLLGYSHSSTGVDALCGLYREIDAAYTDMTVGTGLGGGAYSGVIEIPMPRRPKQRHYVAVPELLHETGGTGTTVSPGTLSFFDATVQPILRARLRASSGSIDGGKVYMWRRREYISG